jgi:hypothetical protein
MTSRVAVTPPGSFTVSRVTQKTFPRNTVLDARVFPRPFSFTAAFFVAISLPYQQPSGNWQLENSKLATGKQQTGNWELETENWKTEILTHAPPRFTSLHHCVFPGIQTSASPHRMRD